MGLSINVKKDKLNKMEFLVNYLKDNQNIEVLDLSNNNIGNTGVKNITKLLEANTAITELNLSDNNIGTKGLNRLCSALAYNKSILFLNISRNPIPWGANKVLLALLYKNPNILEIKYSKYDEEGKEYSESIQEADLEYHNSIRIVNE
jgi:Ran GTPase-activating protein (RanGAP) involved in mRNA processing and transport